jgi:hypothetical protein
VLATFAFGIPQAGSKLRANAGRHGRGSFTNRENPAAITKNKYRGAI